MIQFSNKDEIDAELEKVNLFFLNNLNLIPNGI